jgi:hypothetical protein
VSGDRRLALLVTVIAVPVGIGLDLVIGYSPFPGYGVVIGLLGCMAIIIGSKWVGKLLFDRPPDYYPDDAAPDVQPDVLPPEHPDAARTPGDAVPAARLDPTSGTGEVRG